MEIDKTFIHEVVSHKGLRALIGEERFNELMDAVWNMMSDKEKKAWLDYVSYLNVSEKEKQRAAADEFIANLSESVDLSGIGTWDRFIAKLKEIMVKMGLVDNIDLKDLSALIVASYENLRKNNERNESRRRFRKELSAKEIAKASTPIIHSKGSFSSYSEGEQWAKDNLQGKSYKNVFNNEEIRIGRKSISEMINRNQQEKSVNKAIHLAALQSVPDFIKYGIPAEVHSDTHGRANMNILRLYSAFECDGTTYRVKSTVREVRQGNKYYAYEVQEMELTEERWENQKSREESSSVTNTSTNSITGAKLLKGVKKTNSDEYILDDNHRLFRKHQLISEKQDAEYMDAVNSGDMKKARKMVAEAFKAAFPDTKVVDENGEPKVVYHGTNRKFYIFKKGDIGFHFGTMEHAHISAKEKTEGKKNGRIVPVYLNITNPLILDFDPELWTDDYRNAGKFLLHLKDKGIITLNDVQRIGKSNSDYKNMKPIRDILISKGYDGIIYPNWFENPMREERVDKYEDSYIALVSSQIKSAEPVTYDDNGYIIPLSQRFNAESNDIRFRTSTELDAEFGDAWREQLEDGRHSTKPYRCVPV